MGKFGRCVANLSESENISDSVNEALSASPEATEDSEDSDVTPSEASVNEGSSAEGSRSVHETASKGKRIMDASSLRTEKGKRLGKLRNKK